MTKDRFWEKVNKTESCWLWTGAIGRWGYGHHFANGRRYQAHRYSYELVVGPIPDGLTLDHLCRVTGCVNPSHLEPVTIGENVRRGTTFAAVNARKTHCVAGHPFDDSNTFARPGGGRDCLPCRRRRSREYRQRRAARELARTETT